MPPHPHRIASTSPCRRSTVRSRFTPRSGALSGVTVLSSAPEWWLAPTEFNLDQQVPLAVAQRLLQPGCPARYRLDALGTPSTVVLARIFPNASILNGETVLLFDATVSCGDFAKDVGIANAQHLSSMVRKSSVRKTCRGWSGGCLNPAPVQTQEEHRPRKRRRVSASSAALPADGWWVSCGSDHVTDKMVRSGLFTPGSPSYDRFMRLREAHLLTGVPIKLLFPSGVVLGPRVMPMCATGTFAKDVGIANAQHLSRMLRGLDGRKSCHGWSGGVTHGESPRSADLPPQSCPSSRSRDQELVQMISSLESEDLHLGQVIEEALQPVQIPGSDSKSDGRSPSSLSCSSREQELDQMISLLDSEDFDQALEEVLLEVDDHHRVTLPSSPFLQGLI
eukprot:TRINITY_DN17185_c0_g1_i1.p1 TRINITY_DN17185_c0_g1~~TRINITY_DN17185_c0_g1_i1.p1  ORF type:complete len:393 (+),score=51.19 TRINITY_DN17185_c0_g1_i1:51-1229(+)